MTLAGQTIALGQNGCLVLLTIEREPCIAMDRLCKGLSALMKNGNQGNFGTVTGSGSFSVGDSIWIGLQFALEHSLISRKEEADKLEEKKKEFN